jgi:hypothetical protein
MAKFPDLTGDGEVTQADILKGRGVKAAKKGGLMKHSDMKQDMPMMKKVAGIEATKVVNKHEKKMHGMAKGGVTRADGCITKGHTKGKMISMRMGGKTC